MDTGYTVYAFEFADTGRQSGAPFWSLNFQFDSNPELIDEDRVQVSSSLVSGFPMCRWLLLMRLTVCDIRYETSNTVRNTQKCRNMASLSFEPKVLTSTNIELFNNWAIDFTGSKLESTVARWWFNVLLWIRYLVGIGNTWGDRAKQKDDAYFGQLWPDWCGVNRWSLVRMAQLQSR